MQNLHNPAHEEEASGFAVNRATTIRRTGKVPRDGRAGRVQHAVGVGDVDSAQGCEGFHGRALDLCLGIGRQGRAAPAARAVKAFRAKHGITPGAVMSSQPSRRPQKQPTRLPNGLVGSHLRLIFKALGVDMPCCFGCGKLAADMNRQGAEGCVTHFDHYAAVLRERAKALPLSAKLKAATRAYKLGWDAVRISPIDPMPGLLRLAITRAREELQCASAT